MAGASSFMRVSFACAIARLRSAQFDGLARRQRHCVDDWLFGYGGQERNAGELRAVLGARAVVAVRVGARGGGSSPGGRTGKGVTEQRPGVGGRASAGAQQDGGGNGEGGLVHGFLPDVSAVR